MITIEDREQMDVILVNHMFNEGDRLRKQKLSGNYTNERFKKMATAYKKRKAYYQDLRKRLKSQLVEPTLLGWLHYDSDGSNDFYSFGNWSMNLGIDECEIYENFKSTSFNGVVRTQNELQSLMTMLNIK